MSEITPNQIYRLAALGHFPKDKPTHLSAEGMEAIRKSLNGTMTVEQASDLIKAYGGDAERKQKKRQAKEISALVFAALNAAFSVAMRTTGELPPAAFFLQVSGPGVQNFRPFAVNGSLKRTEDGDVAIIIIPALASLPAEVAKAGYLAFRNIIRANRYEIELKLDPEK